MKSVQKKDLLLGLAAGSIALLVFSGKFGYFFGQGDQDEFIPYLLRLLDPGLYPKDWFINQQIEFFNVRTYFVWLVFPIAKILTPASAIQIIYCISFLSISLAIYCLSLRILKNRPLSLLAPVTILSLSHKWTLGSNDFVYSMLVPEMLSWPFAIWAIDRIVNKSYIIAGVLLGVASWFQVLVGVQSAFIWTIVLAILFFQRKTSFQDCLGFVLAVAVVSLPSTGPIIISLFTDSSLDQDNLAYILAAFRNPFHHLFFSFATGSVVKFFVLFFSGILAWFLFLRSREFEHSKSLLLFIAVSSFLLVINVLLTEFNSVLFVAKLQWFKLTVLIKMMAGILLLGAVKHLAATFFTTPRAWTRQRSWHSITAITILLASLIAWTGLTRNLESNTESLSSMETWVKEHTPQDALFLIPPSVSSFRTHAERSIYINYASFPYRDPDMITWFDRIQQVAPIGRPARGVGIKPHLDQAFHNNIGSKKLLLLNAQYLLLKKEQTVSRLESEIAFENDGWVLYELSSTP